MFSETTEVVSRMDLFLQLVFLSYFCALRSLWLFSFSLTADDQIAWGSVGQKRKSTKADKWQIKSHGVR